MKRPHRRSSKKRGKKMAFIPRAFSLFRVRNRASPCTSVPFSTRSRRQRGRGKKENAERAGGTSAERVDVVLEESPLDGIKGDSASFKLPLLLLLFPTSTSLLFHLLRLLRSLFTGETNVSPVKRGAREKSRGHSNDPPLLRTGTRKKSTKKPSKYPPLKKKKKTSSPRRSTTPPTSTPTSPGTRSTMMGCGL